MARIEESVDIKRPVEQIFTYTTDANRNYWVSVSRAGFVARQEWRRAHDRDLDRVEHTRESSISVPSRLLGATA